MFSHFQNIKFLRAICDWFLRILMVNSLTICIFAMAVIKRSDCPSDFQPKYRAHAENIVTTCVLAQLVFESVPLSQVGDSEHVPTAHQASKLKEK